MRQALNGSLAVLLVALVTGCGAANQSAEAGGQRLPAGVVEALPENVASPPTNLHVPVTDKPPVLRAVYDGKSQVNVTVRSRWRGSSVTLYYLPRYNLLYQGTHYKLMGARGVQRIGKFPIDKNGHWNANWSVGNYPIPPHRPLYMLAITDAGQVALVQMDTL